ncbi:MAG: hypothetical protein LBV09_03730 [Deferribacteraceae bacterium]|jgi:futalosine hydrolase|nr:hypothetical protein [Deferribacteraceae bacterium]
MYSIFVPSEREAEAIFESDSFTTQDGFKGLYYKDQFVTVTGVGKVNAAITLARYLSSHPSSTPLLIGIAGAYKGTIDVGTVCAIDYDHFVDEALYTQNPPKITGTHEIGFPICPENRIKLALPSIELPIYSANTVSMLSSTDELAELYHKKTGAAVESMEGAAFALAAANFNVQVAQIRAISNYCGERSAQQWNIKKAIRAIQDILRIL